MFYNMPTFWKFVNEKGEEYTFPGKLEMNRAMYGLSDTKKGTVYHYIDGLIEDEYKVKMFAGRGGHHIKNCSLPPRLVAFGTIARTT